MAAKGAAAAVPVSMAAIVARKSMVAARVFLPGFAAASFAESECFGDRSRRAWKKEWRGTDQATQTNNPNQQPKPSEHASRRHGQGQDAGPAGKVRDAGSDAAKSVYRKGSSRVLR